MVEHTSGYGNPHRGEPLKAAAREEQQPPDLQISSRSPTDLLQISSRLQADRMNRMTFDHENQKRIQAVESSFGPAGQTLLKSGRILMGEGRLIKQCRRKKKAKAFFLFNDILVYGSILLNGRWHNEQRIIPLEDIQLQDMEENEELKHQFLIRTPQKSFFVSAQSCEEKQAWMSHIRQCQAALQKAGRTRASSSFANSWIPDQAAFKCMRCFSNFSATRRRHHCRKCGFLVCNRCSKHRAVISHIHPTKMQRICSLCHGKLKDEGAIRQRGGSTGKNSTDEEEEEDLAESSEEEEQDLIQIHIPSNWLDLRHGTWGRMSRTEVQQ
ncbi:pleckstrin homology domain-containing family F member 2-like [Salarias fasciatus]|uniref:Pleckstrin homology domain-containing family F member 2-like n=1 Tax=Salarias fasciatus TaxID=181472 RepID=A0A672IY61_SALFA|nr:pleckstrin homology domain-containing family F member 2-like [Salarias fasciatus]